MPSNPSEPRFRVWLAVSQPGTC
ncbi:hypothetical protein LUTEI9C_10120 [Luteimonas sp. 9C]|nr:hypothetical protein LUTEI9C_10120 [Luteimonas sp. 9C]